MSVPGLDPGLDTGLARGGRAPLDGTGNPHRPERCADDSGQRARLREDA